MTERTAPHDDADVDAPLLARYLDQDRTRQQREAAFRELVDRHHRRVFAVCLQVLRDPADAEEATQETFLKLARNADGFRGEAQLSTWLYRVARNACTDLVRREARRPATPVAEVAELADAPVQADGTDATDLADSVARALAALDPLSRQLLVLVGVEGLSYLEAAAATDLAVGTVKSRVSRARTHLAALLSDPDPPPGTPPPHRTSHP